MIAAAIALPIVWVAVCSLLEWVHAPEIAKARRETEM